VKKGLEWEKLRTSRHFLCNLLQVPYVQLLYKLAPMFGLFGLTKQQRCLPPVFVVAFDTRYLLISTYLTSV